MTLSNKPQVPPASTKAVALPTFNVRLSLIERRAILWLGDFGVVLLASLGAVWFWTWTAPEAFTLEFITTRARWLPALMVLYMTLAWVGDMYNLSVAIRLVTVTNRLLSSILVIVVGYLLLFFVIAPTNMLPRLPFIYFIGLTLVGIFGWRYLYNLTLGQGILRQRLLIIGAGRAGSTLAQVIAESKAHIQLIGFVDDSPYKQNTSVANLPILGTADNLLDLIKTYQPDTIAYAITNELKPRMFQTLLSCQAAGLAVVQMPALYEALTGRVPVEHIRHEWLLSNELTGGQVHLGYRLFRRLLDWTFGLIGGLAFLILGPIIALLIKLDSPGPVFYRQTRLGQGGKPFKLIKFRSMVANAEKGTGAKWATSNDPRITRVGQFLRRSRLDELPQIINVLRGDIHLIGPRPERPEFIAELEHTLPFYRARLAMKPGLTGWAQVKYRYGSTVQDALIKLQYDLYYIKNRSIPLDLSILFKTISVILLFKGT